MAIVLEIIDLLVCWKIHGWGCVADDLTPRKSWQHKVWWVFINLSPSVMRKTMTTQQQQSHQRPQQLTACWRAILTKVGGVVANRKVATLAKNQRPWWKVGSELTEVKIWLHRGEFQSVLKKGLHNILYQAYDVRVLLWNADIMMLSACQKMPCMLIFPAKWKKTTNQHATHTSRILAKICYTRYIKCRILYNPGPIINNSG